jgi:Zn-dependent M28 family amino/carboxypeptidase
MVSCIIHLISHRFLVLGSGSAANLELALTLARLFQTSTYAKYKYRIRFCWWGAEELGLLGAAYHVAQAKSSNVTGERLSDYLINLNYDMLGSLNFMFGIYDGRTASNSTPVAALAGSNKITESFRSWFEQENLPWNYTSFDGRSDYGPFLAEGIVAGGLFSGADGIKSVAEQNYYEQMLGPGLGGTAFVIHDPCYHRPCDVIANINSFGYEILVRGAANILEYLARQDDLKTWLYPSGRVTHIDKQDQHRPPYDSINEYFRIPYV